MKIGINLTGGGARGSYQAGVLLGLAELLKKHHLLGDKNPFQYWSGVSAGSINMAYAVAGIDDLAESCYRLTQLWANIKAEQVFKTDFFSVSRNSARWIRDLSLGPLASTKRARALLDTTPLTKLLSDGVFYDKIQSSIDRKLVQGIACSAFSYRDGRTVSFIQTNDDVHWDKPKRYSIKTPIKAEHIMASCAIPILFPAISLGGHYMADGSFRCTTPISPVIHLGAQKILMIGVRGPSEINTVVNSNEAPGVAKIAGHILNALFFDSIDVDLERILHINELIDVMKGNVTTDRSHYSKIDVKLIRPSEDIAKLADQKARSSLPRTIDYLLSGLGSHEETAELASYILFEKRFTKELVELGYQDFLNQSDSIAEWLL